jgi:hypothetical protein
MLATPLEQFQIISLFSIKLFCLDFSITNLLLINLISFSTSSNSACNRIYLSYDVSVKISLGY